MKKASTSENDRAQITTTGSTPSMDPMRPSIRASGTNAAQVVSTAAMTGAATSVAPSSAACRGGTPARSFVKMFSPITMASSTIRPSTTIRPNREIRLIVAPARPIRRNVPAKETRRPAATHSAMRSSRKMASVSSTSRRPAPALRFIRSSRCSMKRARSVVIATWTAPPAGGCSRATNDFTAAAISTASCSGVLKTVIEAARDVAISSAVGSGAPSSRSLRSRNRPRSTRSSKWSRITATSRSRTRLPSERVRTTMSSRRAATCCSPSVRTRMFVLRPLSWPPGRSRFVAETARPTSAKDTPKPSSFSGRISTRISRCRKPVTVTSVTSGRSSNSSRTSSTASCSTRSGTRPWSTIAITGICGRASVISGSSAPSGRSGCTRSRSLLSSLRTRSRSASSSSTAEIRVRPSNTFDSMRSTPSTLSISRSISRVTDFSTSSGVAPG